MNKIIYYYKLYGALVHLWMRRLIRSILRQKWFYTNRFVKACFISKAVMEIDIREKRGALFLPESVEVEITNACNVDCIFCPNSTHQRSRGVMDFNTFKITLDRLKGIPIKSLILSGFGECLLDRKLIDKLRYLKARQQAGDLTGNSMLVTNGVALVPELSQVIVREDLVDVVSISIDCGTRTTYEKIHKYDGFDTIITNLEHIFRLKSSLRKAVPEINLRYKDFDLNQGEFMTFLRLFQPISNSIHIYANICKWPNSREKLPTILKSIMIRKPCVGNLWNGIRINWNGDVTICPQDYEGTAIYGNVLRSTIAELWHGPQIKEYRAMHKAFQFQKIPCCADCDINSHLVSLF